MGCFFWRLLLTRCGRHQLLHEALTVRKTPLLNDLSSNDSVDGSLMDGHLLTVRCHSRKLASLSSA